MTEQLYQLYLVDCINKKMTPTIRDFAIWAEEEGYELDLEEESNE